MQKVRKFRRCGTNSYVFEGPNPHCDLDLEDRKANFSHDTPRLGDTPTYQVLLLEQRSMGSQDIVMTNYIFPEDLNPDCDHDLEDRNTNISHDTPRYGDTPTYQVLLLEERSRGSEDIVWKTVFPEDLNPDCDHDLEQSNPNTPARDDTPLHQVWLQKV